jgi:hypothetical protein
MLQGFVAVSPELQGLILFGVTALVSFLLLQLANAVPWLAEYLGQYKAGIVTWLVGLIVQLLNAQLQRIPASWDEVVVLVMQLIVTVAGVLLAFAGWRKVKAPGASAL